MNKSSILRDLPKMRWSERLEARLVENKITVASGIDLHARKSDHDLRI